MTALEAWVRTPVNEALGWALLHSLWQGATAAALLAATVARRSAEVRYLAGCSALTAIGLSFAATFWRALPSGFAQGHRAIPLPGALPDFALGAVSGTGLGGVDLMPWLTPIWLVGVVCFQLRMAGGWLGTIRLRRSAVCDVPGRWKTGLAELAARMRVSRPVQLLESGLAEVPIVAGHLRPVILMPAGLLCAIPPAHIEAILLHELAHVRRHDYLVNLLQSIFEGLFFYHPAVRWISGFIRAEREHCCDDLAVAASTSGGAHGYALALTELEHVRCLGTLRNRTAATVAATGGSLMKRIHRLLSPPSVPAPSGVSTLAPVIVLAALASLAAITGASPPQTREADPGPYVKWLNEDVVYIIDTREREAFSRLKTAEERERFIEQFWQRRDPTPGTAENESKEEHYRRIEYANVRFPSPGKSGWRTDRGRIFIVYGPPDEIEAHPSGQRGGPPSEKWLYRRLEGIGTGVIVEFVDADRDGQYRQTRDPRARK